MIEIFKDINGYNGLYQISNFGRVCSYYNGNKHMLKLHKNNRGYIQVSLSLNKKIKVYTVHRLVAQTFLPNPNNLPCVNHKDECKTNNHVDNLEWCTYDYNNKFGTRNERIGKSNSVSQIGLNINNPNYSKVVLQYTKDNILVAEYPSIQEAVRQTGLYHGNISNCCKGKYHSCGGFIWRYK